MELKELLKLMVDKNASDLHLRSDKHAVFRVDGNLTFKTPAPIPGEDIDRWIKSIMSERQARLFDERMECDLPLSVEGIGRFRVNIYRQRGLVNVAFRHVPAKIPSFEQLKLPSTIRKLTDEPRGLILVTGTTGSGKTTTLAAMIDYINATRTRHIITIEDPIEYVHEDKQSIISQRELHSDTLNFADALKFVVRQDTDVIF